LHDVPQTKDQRPEPRPTLFAGNEPKETPLKVDQPIRSPWLRFLPRKGDLLAGVIVAGRAWIPGTLRIDTVLMNRKPTSIQLDECGTCPEVSG
jgi:hypothetical protein